MSQTIAAMIVALTMFSARSQAPPQATAEHLQRGIELIDAGSPREALVELEQAVSMEPGNPRVRYHMGRALFALGQYDEAISHLSIGLPVAADPSAFGLVMGQSLIELGRLSEARAVLDRADSLRPDYPPIRLQFARICYRAGDVDTAMQKYEDLNELAPRWVVPRLQAASISAEAGDQEAAARFFRAALSINARQPLTLVRLGDTLEANLDFEGAVASYRSAIEMAPELLQARLALAYLFFNRQQFEDAEVVFNELSERLPDDPQVVLPMAEIRMIDGAHEEALASIESAIATLDGAAAEARLEEVAGAGSQLATLRLRALELRAKTLLSLNRLSEAEAAARTLLETDPASLDGLFVLGTALVRAGSDDGREHLTRFQQLSDTREHRELAYDFLVRGSDPERAAVEFEAALAIDPDDAAALTGLGTARLAQADAPAAIELLARARAAGASSVELYREWVLALHAVGRTAEARQMWQEVRTAGIDLGPRVWAALGEHRGAC